MLRNIISASAAVFLAAPAIAGTAFTATLANPIDNRTDFVANKAVWICEDTTCNAELRRKSPTVRACKEVAKEIGELASYESERGSLSEAELAECNTRAKK